MSTSEQALSKIFCEAGPLVLPPNHELILKGQSPTKTFTNVWYHKHGTVVCDPKYNWKFEPYPSDSWNQDTLFFPPLNE